MSEKTKNVFYVISRVKSEIEANRWLNFLLSKINVKLIISCLIVTLQKCVIEKVFSTCSSSLMKIISLFA